MEKQTINVEDFFTEDYEAEGIWFEPKIKGEPCGIQFLVTGTGTDKNVAIREHYEKEQNKLGEIKDPVEKVKKQKILDAELVSEFVAGIRAAEGSKLLFEGKPIEYSKPFIKKLFEKAPLLKVEVIRFARDTTNFIKREKNDSKKQ